MQTAMTRVSAQQSKDSHSVGVVGDPSGITNITSSTAFITQNHQTPWDKWEATVVELPLLIVFKFYLFMGVVVKKK